MSAKIARFTEPAISREALAARAAGAGIRVRQDDPVLDAAIITDLLLRDSAAALAAQMAEIGTVMAGAVGDAKTQREQTIAEAKIIAARIITEAPPYLIDQFKKGIGDVTGEALTEIRAERQKAESASRFARIGALVIGAVCLLIAAIAAGYAAAAFFGH